MPAYARAVTVNFFTEVTELHFTDLCRGGTVRKNGETAIYSVPSIVSSLMAKLAVCIDYSFVI